MTEEENKKQEEKQEDSEAKEKPAKRKPVEELEKINNEKIRGRVIVINPDKSEFAKELKLEKKGDYSKKKK